MKMEMEEKSDGETGREMELEEGWKRGRGRLDRYRRRR